MNLKWTKHCVLAVAGVGNAHANCNNIILTIKYTKIYLPVVILSTKENQELSKFLSKGFNRSVYWNEYETKSERKTTTSEHRYFLQSRFVGVNKLFVLVYSNQENILRYIAKRYYLTKGIINNYNIIINGKSFYDQPIDFDINRYEEIRKLTTGQDEDYTTG